MCKEYMYFIYSITDNCKKKTIESSPKCSVSIQKSSVQEYCNIVKKTKL